MAFSTGGLIPKAILNWRNRQLASEKFQEWAATFRLTRPMAKKKASDIFDICAGFVYSQILFACVELDLFSLLRDRSLTAAEIAQATDLPIDAADRLARAAVSLKLFARLAGHGGAADSFMLGEHGAALLGNSSVFAMVRHHATLYKDLTDPVALLRERHQGTHLAKYWGYATDETPEADEDTAQYSDLMAQTQQFISEEVLACYSFGNHKTLMDVGGGAGAFVHHVARHYDQIALRVFDLPSVVTQAQHRFEQSGQAERLTAFGGNFFKDDLPQGADIVSLVRILHDHEDESVKSLLRSVRRCLCDQGRVLIVEPMAQTPGAEAMGDGYFGMYLWAMGSGRPRSATTLKAFLKEAGFKNIREIQSRRPILTRILTADR